MKTAIKKLQSLPFFLAFWASMLLGGNTLQAQSSIPSNAVAYLTSSGGVQVYENRLVPQLHTGDPVLFFQVYQAGGTYYLLRKGMSQGYAVTEIIPLSVSGSYIIYNPTYFKSCRTMECDGLSIGSFCNPILIPGEPLHCECLENSENPCTKSNHNWELPTFEVVTANL